MVLPSDSQSAHQSSVGLPNSDPMTPERMKHARDVGREFVYLYYLSLNECPQDLHRFYATSSIFIHGGLERPENEQKPAIGQVEISHRINALNFQDCRTKILMVDSVPAPNLNVIIQVCGEISNNANPMRRFMQTFLLSPNGPKKYFVQNNIFRYQDEVFHESDGEDEVACSSTGVPEPVATISVDHSGREDAHDYGTDGAGEHQDPPPAFLDDKQPPVINGDGNGPVVEDYPDVPSDLKPEPLVEPEPVSTQPKEPAAKKTFATLFNSGGGPAAGNGIRQAPKTGHGNAPVQKDQAAPVIPADQAPPTSNGHGAHPPMNESNQLFVGNIKKTVKEEDLREFFSQFGTVVHARITQGKPKQGQQMDVPNFGFVGFADAESVQAVLDKKPIFMNNERLNVEAKKGSVGGGGFGGRMRGSGGRGGGMRGGGARFSEPRVARQ